MTYEAGNSHVRDEGGGLIPCERRTYVRWRRDRRDEFAWVFRYPGGDGTWHEVYHRPDCRCEAINDACEGGAETQRWPWPTSRQQPGDTFSGPFSNIAS